MKKVKLTQGQAEAIEKLKSKNKGNVFYAIEEHAFTFADDDDYWLHEFKPLNDMGIADVAEVLVNGYEVEETFKVGDWVMHEPSKWLGEVTRIYEDELEVTRLGDGYIWNKKYVRHATPEEIAEEKQRRWWAKHGRNVYEFKEGDLIKRGDTTSEVEKVEEKIIWVKLNKSKGTYTKEYYDQIKVICFAEDRKDLDGDEE